MLERRPVLLDLDEPPGDECPRCGEQAELGVAHQLDDHARHGGDERDPSPRPEQMVDPHADEEQHRLAALRDIRLRPALQDLRHPSPPVDLPPPDVNGVDILHHDVNHVHMLLR
jgi:hypothetical protein